MSKNKDLNNKFSENLEFIAKIINPYNKDFEKDLEEYELRNYTFSWREFDIASEIKKPDFHYNYQLSNFPRNIYLQGRKILDFDDEEIGIVIIYYNAKDDIVSVYYMEFSKTKGLKDIDKLIKSLVLGEFGIATGVDYKL